MQETTIHVQSFLQNYVDSYLLKSYNVPEVPANVSVFGRRLQMQEDVFQVSLQSGLAKASNTSLPPPEDLRPV